MKSSLILLATLPLMVAAQTFTVGEGRDELVTMRFEDVKNVGANKAAWLLAEYKTPRPDGAKSARMLLEFDCAGKRHRLVSGSLHSGPRASGSTLKEFGETQWGHTPPGTLWANAQLGACGS